MVQPQRLFSLFPGNGLGLGFWLGGAVLCLLIPAGAQAGREQVVALAPGTIQQFRFLKHSDEKAKAGMCVAPPKGDPNEVLRSAGMSTVNARPGEIEALARGVQQIQALSGETAFGPIKNAKFVFKNSSPKSTGQASGGWNGQHIHIERNGAKADENVAHLMHELGHFVGSQEGLYTKYRTTVGTGCHYSYRCQHNLRGNGPRQEEFAEVFAAFVLHPELLKKSGPNCQAAYAFFADKVFAKGRDLAFCGATLPQAQRLAMAEGPIPARVPRVSTAALVTPRAPTAVAAVAEVPCKEPLQPSNRTVLSLGEHLRAVSTESAN